MGADRFLANNKRDFPPTITEVHARTIWFSRQADQHEVRAMPGAYTTGSYVAFRISVPDGVAHATAAARKVKR